MQKGGDPPEELGKGAHILGKLRTGKLEVIGVVWPAKGKKVRGEVAGGWGAQSPFPDEHEISGKQMQSNRFKF